MEDNLFTYELGAVKDSYFPCIEQPHDNLKNGDLDVYEPLVCYHENEQIYAEAVILINKILVRRIDITMEPWLDLKFRDHNKVDKEVMEEVVSTWLVRIYRKQFEEYMEIKRRLEVYGLYTDVECDPSNVDFAECLASKFSNHMMMDWYTKNALWIYWTRGDDEEVLTDDELSDLEEEKFKEFNHLLQIDVDMLTGDLPGFKTYDDYKDAWIYEWNKEVLWVEEKPWLDDGTWKEPNDDICHECKPFKFKSGHIEWPSCNSNKDGYCNGGNLPGMIQVEKTILEGSWGHENREGNNFFSRLKECFGNYHELDYELMRKLEEYWFGKKEEEESSEDAWSNYSSNNDNDTIQADQEWFNNHEPLKDYDIMYIDDYLIPQDASYYFDEEVERFKERKSKLLGMPNEKPPTFKFEKFKVIKYSLGPAEEYVAIKEHEYDIWLRTKENVSYVYKEIFHKKDEGWSMTRTK
ncbi:hypothetical protein Tco_1012816 [Tanacetum coccineum]